MVDNLLLDPKAVTLFLGCQPFVSKLLGVTRTLQFLAKCVYSNEFFFLYLTPQHQSKVSTSLASGDLLSSSACLGADTLLKLLGNYCRNKDIKTAITVGIVGTFVDPKVRRRRLAIVSL